MGHPKPRDALRLAILFALISILWILVSDALLTRLTTDPVLLTRLQSVKGGAFIAVTALLLYLLVRRELLRLERRDAQIHAIEQHLHLQSATLESVATAIAITDREGRITRVNPAFSRLTGYAAAEAIGQTPRLLKSGEHDQAFYQKLWETILSGQVWHGELINRRKDGGLYFEEQTVTPVRDAAGAIGHFISVKQDITERKRAEAALRESEAKFRNLVEKTSDWVWETDERNRYTYVSPRIREILGYATEEVLAKTPFDLMPAEEAKRVAEVFAPISGHMKPFLLLDNVNLHREGHRVILETSGSPIFDSQGVFRGYRGIGRDVTQRRRAEEEIRSVARFPAENPQPVLRVNQDGILLYANEASQALTRDWRCAVGSPAPPPWPDTVREALASRSSRIIDLPCGNRIYSFFVAPVPEAGYVNLYGRDITERMRAEEALRTRTNQLEAVRAVSEEITRELDLTNLLDLVHRRAAELVGAKRGAILLWDEANQCLGARAWHGYGSWVSDVRLRLGEGVAGVVAQRREGLIVNEYRSSPYAHPLFLERFLDAAVLCEPLLYRGRLLGVIILAGSPSDGQFTGEDQQLLRLFAAQAAIAIERARLHSAAVRRGEQLEALLRATRSVMSGPDLPGILTRIVAEAAQMAGTPHVTVMLVDQPAQILRVAALAGDPVPPGFAIPLGMDLSGHVAQTGQPVFSADSPNDPRNLLAQRDRGLGFTTYLGLPIKVRDEVLGVLSFDTTTPRHYPPTEVAYLASFADQAAIAIENARLFQQEQVRRAQLEAVRAVSTEITRELNLAALLDLITRRAAELVSAGSGAVYLWDEAAQVLVPQAWLGHGEWIRDLRLRPGEAVAGTVAERREGMIVNDFRTTPYAVPLILERTNHTAVLAEPLLYHDRLLGVIVLNNSETKSRFTEDDQYILQLFATQAAIVIENARLHSAAVRRGEQLEALLRATRSVMSGLDLQGILDRILAEAAQISGCSHVKVLLVDREAGVLRVGALQGTAMCSGDRLSVGKGHSGIVAATGQPLFSEDAPNDPRNAYAALDRELGIVTYLGLPIRIRDEVLGVLTFNTTTSRRYTPDELAYLESFADQAAIAIENARLYAESLQHAAALEQRVQERTRELEAARAQAEEASRHKSEFLANMSHELRTPLHSIIGFSQILQEHYAGPLAEKQARFVGHIYHAGEHLLELVNDVLDLSKVESGKLTLELEALPIADMLEEIRVIARALANKKRQTFDLHVEPALPPLRCDPVRFRQICFNLVSNAAKFTPPGGRITLTARRVTAAGDQGSGLPQRSPAPGPWLEIGVSDTGIGIEPKDIPRLFQAFTQLEAAATKRHEGTGLGLALTKRLVELHGGRIWAASEGEGRGSTFTVMLPLAGPRH